MSEDSEDIISQFKSIAGLDDSSDENIRNLLTVHNSDLNNAISSYFDTGFDSIQSSSGAQVHEEESTLRQRRESFPGRSNRDDSIVNLQNQMFLDNYLPKLPRAPRISNHWQLEIGIHSSLRDLEQEKRSQDGAQYSVQSKVSGGAFHSLWLILLVIPKSILQILVSIFKYFLGSSSTRNKSRFPKSFDYDEYDPNYKFLDRVPTSKEADDSTLVDSDSSWTSGLSRYNLKESGFNEVYETTQRGYSWLLLIIVNGEMDNFILQLLNDPSFRKCFDKDEGIFKENNIFIGNSQKSPEIFEVGKTYEVRSLPFITLIGNVSNNPAVMASMSMVYKSNISSHFLEDHKIGSTVKKISKSLYRLLESFNPQLITQRLDKEEIEFSRLVKQQQDEAYQESLYKDKVKREQKENELQEVRNLKIAKLQRAAFFESLNSQNWEETLNGPLATRVSLKLPNGERIIKSISKEIELNDLYLYVDFLLHNAKLQSNDSDADDDDDSLSVEESLLTREEFIAKFPFNFELIQPYPKKVIESGDTRIQDVPELKSGANLLVEFTLVEDDEE